jgi:hypothetical protein
VSLSNRAVKRHIVTQTFTQSIKRKSDKREVKDMLRRILDISFVICDTACTLKGNKVFVDLDDLKTRRASA